MSKVTRGFYDGYVASAYWSTSKLSKPTHYIGYVTLNDDDINKLKHFGSVLITCFSTDKLGDVYPCYQQDFTEIGFDLSKDKPIGKHPYGNELALVFEEDNAPPVQHDKNEQLAEKELAGDLLLDDSSKTKITTAPPVVKPKEKTSKYQQRYDDCKAWLESENPPIKNKTQKQIEKLLLERDKSRELKLWHCGLKEFWEKQDLITFERGCKPLRQYK